MSSARSARAPTRFESRRETTNATLNADAQLVFVNAASALPARGAIRLGVLDHPSGFHPLSSLTLNQYGFAEAA
jgi:hypothetical protein